MSSGSRHFWKQESFRRRAETVWSVYLCTRTEGLRDELLEMYMPMVRIAARQVLCTVPQNVSLEDLEVDAALGLLHAIEQWDPNRSSFATYSLKRMRGAMLDGLRGRDPVTRWGRMLRTRLWKAKEEYREVHGAEPTVAELSHLSGLPYEVCARHRGLITNAPFISIEAEAEKRDSAAPSEKGYDRLSWLAEEDPDRYFRDVMVEDFIEWLLAQIVNERDRRICHAYLVEGVTQRDIGTAEGVHETYIYRRLERCRAIWLERSRWLQEEKEMRDE